MSDSKATADASVASLSPRRLLKKQATDAAIAKSKDDRDPPYNRYRMWPNVLAVGYICGAYCVGMWAIFGGDREGILTHILRRWCIGVPLLAHAMIWAAYMVHECAHGTIFHSVDLDSHKQNEAHKWLGEIMLWICGAIYTPYHVIKNTHNRHHTWPYDVVDWDIHELLNHTSWPGRIFRSVILTAERAYIPILEWIMYGHIMVAPFGGGCLPKTRKYRGRGRVILLALVRIGLFLLFTSGWDRWISLMAYFSSCTLFLHIMRFGDMFQHTYETVMLDKNTGAFKKISTPKEEDGKEEEEGDDDISKEKIDRAKEQAETYSPIFIGNRTEMRLSDDAMTRTQKVEQQGTWYHKMIADILNLFFFLNFGFHNAHHDNTRVPWYDLPWQHRNSVHKSIYDEQTLPVPLLLKLWKRDRIDRIDATSYGKKPADDLDGFKGALNVSFLYPFA